MSRQSRQQHEYHHRQSPPFQYPQNPQYPQHIVPQSWSLGWVFIATGKQVVPQYTEYGMKNMSTNPRRMSVEGASNGSNGNGSSIPGPVIRVMRTHRVPEQNQSTHPLPLPSSPYRAGVIWPNRLTAQRWQGACFEHNIPYGRLYAQIDSSVPQASPVFDAENMWILPPLPTNPYLTPHPCLYGTMDDPTPYPVHQPTPRIDRYPRIVRYPGIGYPRIPTYPRIDIYGGIGYPRICRNLKSTRGLRRMKYQSNKRVRSRRSMVSPGTSSSRRRVEHSMSASRLLTAAERPLTPILRPRPTPTAVGSSRPLSGRRRAG